MKKYLFVLVVTAMMAAGAVSLTLSDKETLYLYEKDPDDNYSRVEDGAWGCMQYRPDFKTFAFWFGAMYLEPCTDYTLIYYPDPWPGAGLICLGEGTTDAKGRIHINGTADTGDLPKDFDDNYLLDGAKIWLVLSDDVDCVNQVMTGWNPTEWLFEDELITFDDWYDN